MSRREPRRSERSAYRRRSKRRRNSSSRSSSQYSEKNGLEQGEVRLARANTPLAEEKFGVKPSVARKPYKVVFQVADGFIAQLTNNNTVDIGKAQEAAMVKEFYLGKSRSNEGVEYQTLSIFDEDEQKKWSCTDRILGLYSEYLKSLPVTEPSETAEARILEHVLIIPDGLVSLLIGKKGRQILSIMSDTKTKIVVSKTSEMGGEYRTVAIRAELEPAKKAVRAIINLVEQTFGKLQTLDFKKNLEVDKDANVEAMMVIPEISELYVIGVKGSIAEGLSAHFQTKIKVFQNKKIRCVDNNESILSIAGKLVNVQDTLIILIRRLHEYAYNEQAGIDYYKTQSAGEHLRILISNQFVSKLIGKGGSMVRELAAKSLGAQIKILSDRKAESSHQFCIVTVAGTLANKQDAVCSILEQIEDFRQRKRASSSSSKSASRDRSKKHSKRIRDDERNGHHESPRSSSKHSRDRNRPNKRADRRSSSSPSSRNPSPKRTTIKRRSSGSNSSQRTRRRDSKAPPKMAPSSRVEQKPSIQDSRASAVLPPAKPELDEQKVSGSKDKRNRSRSKSRELHGDLQETVAVLPPFEVTQHKQPDPPNPLLVQPQVVEAFIILKRTDVHAIQNSEGKVIEKIVERTGCSVCIKSEESELYFTPDGHSGRLLQFKGARDACLEGIRLVQQYLSNHNGEVSVTK